MVNGLTVGLAESLFLPLTTPVIQVLASVTGINAKTVANTALYVSPKTAVIVSAIIRCTAASGITGAPTLGVGNIAGTNNIFASTTLSTLTTTSSVFGFQLLGASLSTPPSGTIYLNIGTGSSGTSQTIAVDLIGYLL